MCNAINDYNLWDMAIVKTNSAYEFIIDDGVIGFYLKYDINISENKNAQQSA
jgi:hypothetical protein